VLRGCRWLINRNVSLSQEVKKTLQTTKNFVFWERRKTLNQFNKEI